VAIDLTHKQSVEAHKSEARTLASSAYAEIRRDIVDLVLRPGEKLRLKDIGERYGYGLAPLREALSRLTSDNLVAAEDQRGFSVTDVSLRDLLDLTFVRRNLEAVALRASIENGDDEWEGDVVAAFHRLSLAQMRRQDDPSSLNTDWKERHQAFHHAIVSGCGSPRLLAMRDLLFDQSDRYRRVASSQITVSRDISGEHQAIFDATIARKSDLACELIAEHIDRTAEIARQSTLE
jgi:DNA-binding GntR family transcriptional regulator